MTEKAGRKEKSIKERKREWKKEAKKTWKTWQKKKGRNERNKSTRMENKIKPKDNKKKQLEPFIMGNRDV